MGIFKFLFKSKPLPPSENFEIVETHLPIDDQRYKVRIRKGGRELYVEDLFRTAEKPEDSPSTVFACSMKTRQNRILPPLYSRR